MSEPFTSGLSMDIGARDLSPSTVKQCCATAYESEAAKLLLGDSFHPGGTRLTERLGQILTLTPRMRVLDVAAGKGTSAFFLATTFGCDVVGIDYSPQNVEQANSGARDLGLSGRVSFQLADAEQLPFGEGVFDAIICECAFCTFPNKRAAANEFFRVLRPGGQVAISDLTRNGALTPELNSLLSWIACIADAQPLSTYAAILNDANLTVRLSEEHNAALAELVNQVRTRLLAAEILTGLKKLALPGLDLEAAKRIANHALAAINESKLGYAIIAASKTT